jgi:hypothetical protein
MLDDEDEFDDDYHPQAPAVGMGMDAPLDPDEEDDDDLDDSEEIDGEEVEEMTADQLDGEDEDADEEMHDRGRFPLSLSVSRIFFTKLMRSIRTNAPSITTKSP